MTPAPVAEAGAGPAALDPLHHQVWRRTIAAVRYGSGRQASLSATLASKVSRAARSAAWTWSRLVGAVSARHHDTVDAHYPHPSASRNGRALAIASAYSSAGTESQVTAPPLQYQASAPCNHALRMSTLASSDPFGAVAIMLP